MFGGSPAVPWTASKSVNCVQPVAIAMVQTNAALLYLTLEVALTAFHVSLLEVCQLLEMDHLHQQAFVGLS